MKQILVIIISVLFSVSHTQAQDYVPFPTDSATWSLSNEWLGLGVGGWEHNLYELNGDTVISEINYKKIFKTSNGDDELEYIGGLREDSIKRIYFRPDAILESPGSGCIFENILFQNDSTDYLLYDFGNMNVGDTLFYEDNLDSEYLDFVFVVLEITTIDIDGSPRKMYRLQDELVISYPNEETYFIEGIGSSRGLLAPYAFDSGGVGTTVLSCYNDAEVSWISPLHGEVIDCQFGLSIQEHNLAQLTLHPNPSESSVFISGDLPFSRITLSNTLGQQLEQLDFFNVNSTELNVSDLPEGTYYIQVTGNGFSSTKRFVKI